MLTNLPSSVRRAGFFLFVALGCLLTDTLARAADATRSFNIPAGDAEKTLALFTEQSGEQVLYSSTKVAGVRTNPVQGEMPPADALAILVDKTGLVVIKDSQTNSYTIRREAPVPDPEKNVARRRDIDPAAITPQSASAAKPGEKAAAGDEVLKLDEVVITGVSYAQTQFESSFAVTSLPYNEIQKIGPLNLANLLGQVPGIFTESTGGEIQNVIRLRGIPNESSFQAFQVDGLPIYPDEGFFFKGEGIVRTDLMTKSFEIVRGGPSPIFASNAAAIYNNVTRQGDDVSDSALQLTLGDTNLYRLDGYWAGKIADKTYLAFGGFVRRNDGPRPNGFPSDHGGQVQINLRRQIEGGEAKLSLLVLNDHNVFYLPIPVADPRNPSVSLNPYLNYFTGTLNTPYLQNALFLYPNEAGQVQSTTRDLSNGRHLSVVSPTLDVSREIGAWRFSNKFRLTDMTLNGDFLYSTSNPADYATFAAGFLAAARTAFGGTTPVDHLGYAVAGTGGATVYNPAAASGLVIQAQYRAVDVDCYSAQDEARMSRDFDLLGTHHGILGVYATEYVMTERSRYQDYLFELASNPRPLDLLAYSATNQVLGSVTDRGVLRYSNTLNAGHSDLKEGAIFAADTWDLTSQFKLDYGLRHERYSGSGYSRLTKSSPMNLPGTLAGSNAVAFTGSNVITHYSESVTPWTVGANYDFSRHLGVYARASTSFRVGSESILAQNQVPTTTRAVQYEVGAKFNYHSFSAFLTAFQTKFDPYVQTFQAVNPVTGTTGNLNFVGRAQTPGIEGDITWKPFRHFSIDSSITYNRPRGGNYYSSLGADASAAEGKQLIRTPDLFGNIRPTLHFELGKWSVRTDLRYNFVSRRYVDIKNMTELPAYRTLAAGLTAEQGPWSFHLMVDNLTDAKGLTEGNPRADVVSGQGSAVAVYGRPLFGRSFRLESTYHF